MAFTIVTPEQWRCELGEHPFATPFHNIDWLTMVQKFIGGDLTLYSYRDELGVWMVPCFSGTPWATSGFRVGAIGYGGPLPPMTLLSPVDLCCRFETLLDALGRFREQTCDGAVTFPNTSWDRLKGNGQTRRSVYDTQVLPLFASPLMLAAMKKPIRNAISKAERLGVVVRLIRESEIEEAQTILAETQRRVGASYVTSARFLCALTAHGPMTKVFVAKVGESIAGVAAVLFGKSSAFHLLHGWDRGFASTCSNQALLWQIIQDCYSSGATTFDMGRSHYSSLALAKSQWGAYPTPVLVLNRASSS